MSEIHSRSAAEELITVTRWEMRTFGNQDSELFTSLGWLGTDALERERRVNDFELVNQRLNVMVESPAGIPDYLKDVGLLAKDLGGSTLPSLEKARNLFYSDSDVAHEITLAIESAADEHPEWAKVNSAYPSDGAPAVGSLVEGYATFLRLLHQNGDIGRHYVLAFEEVLIADFPDSILVDDVIGWMVEEIDSFPEEIRPLIAARS